MNWTGGRYGHAQGTVVDLGLKRIRDFGFKSYGWVGFLSFQNDPTWLTELDPRTLYSLVLATRLLHWIWALGIGDEGMTI